MSSNIFFSVGVQFSRRHVRLETNIITKYVNSFWIQSEATNVLVLLRCMLFFFWFVFASIHQNIFHRPWTTFPPEISVRFSRVARLLQRRCGDLVGVLGKVVIFVSLLEFSKYLVKSTENGKTHGNKRGISTRDFVFSGENNNRGGLEFRFTWN